MSSFNSITARLLQPGDVIVTAQPATRDRGEVVLHETVQSVTQTIDDSLYIRVKDQHGALRSFSNVPGDRHFGILR